jgi:hypothetical protein
MAYRIILKNRGKKTRYVYYADNVFINAGFGGALFKELPDAEKTIFEQIKIIEKEGRIKGVKSEAKLSKFYFLIEEVRIVKTFLINGEPTKTKG